MTAVHTKFGQDYQVEVLHDFPGVYDESMLHFPNNQRGIGADGILLKVTPNSGRAWSAIFAFGDFEFSGIYTCPNPDHICVVSNGEGYLVNVRTAMILCNLKCYPICGCFQHTAKDLLILYDYRNVTAIGREGLRWRSITGADDDFQIERFDSDYLYASATDCGQTRILTISLDTGIVG